MMSESASDSWRQLVSRGAAKLADALVDSIAIGAIAWMAVSGVEAATLQVVGGMVASIAIGKRYYQNKRTP